MSFDNGHSKHRTRRHGVNDAPQGVLDFFKDFLSSPEYRRNLKKRILAGEANHMEILGHYYAFGNPRKRVVVDPPPKSTFAEALRHLPKEDVLTMYELVKKAEAVAARQAGSTPSGSSPTPSATSGGSR